ncbi:CRP-like cAMP-binding protein [Litoreibacter halocynthiae]|uniref:CRP-like cAMP-binding protein n=1 Tax=Litoreibacter halocynthiae TaxID=1242689 RepID=A0A4R7LPC1_9RHOB|nr:Crp/Fnr family transcriptional regulator [Litoreibacter halocynthiae]TDT77967.1 CRP-like cAMP-binding protein [Litoreibacter halocynthiae]
MISKRSSDRIHTTLTDAILSDHHAPTSRAPQGKTLTFEGDFADHSLLLLEGWIALSKTLASGETQIIDVMLPGDFALVGTRIVPVAACTVEALSDIEYINIQPDKANGPDTASAHLREVLAASILTTQSRTSELLLRMGRGNAASRVAYALIEFHTRLQAVGRTDGNILEFPINQQKFGEFTGLTNVHVCRTLRRFEREGIIAHPDSRSIALTDMKALCTLADVDLDLFRDEILIRHPLHGVVD